jgi:hypothetical protein
MCDPDFHSSPTIVAEPEMADSPTVIDVPDPIALQQRSRLAVTVNAIRFMVDGEELTGKDRWTARGFQYQRLRTAFGIKKRWSSSMPKVYMAEILMGSASKLSSEDWSDRTFGGDWKDLRERAIAYCQKYQQEQSTPRKLNLAGPVQFMTLKLYLSYLFPAKEQLNTLKSVRYQHIPGEVHFSRSAFRDIVYIGQRTNELLAASEQEEAECPRWGDEKKLHQALQRLFTPYSYHWFPVRFIHFVCEIVWRTSSACFHQVLRWWKGPAYTRVLDNSDRKRPDPKRPEANPMNWILPAYDPVWRVVMRCFLEIRYRASGGNENHSEIMRRYLEDLTVPYPTPLKRCCGGKRNQRASGHWTSLRKHCASIRRLLAYTADSVGDTRPRISNSAIGLSCLLERTRCYFLQSVGRASARKNATLSQTWSREYSSISGPPKKPWVSCRLRSLAQRTRALPKVLDTVSLLF